MGVQNLERLDAFSLPEPRNVKFAHLRHVPYRQIVCFSQVERQCEEGKQFLSGSKESMAACCASNYRLD
jgi:hypothetical protein